MLPKSFLQFETSRSLVLAPNPLPRSPQKFNSINALYIEVTIPKLQMQSLFFAVLPVSWLPEDKTIQGLPSLNVVTSHSYRGPQTEQLLPLLIFLFRPQIAKNHHFLGSQKFKYFGTPVMIFFCCI